MEFIFHIVIAAALIAAAVFLYATRPKPRRGGMGADEVLAAARGETIIVGENHADRAGLQAALVLIRAAHERGYRMLGVETASVGKGPYSGLREELEHLRAIGPEGTLTEFDPRSSLDDRPGAGGPRMNRYWQMQEALRLGWRVVAFDPYHWNWMRETEEGYCDSREPAMADAILRHGPMIAVCGYGHLHGLRRRLGDQAFLVVASEVRERDAGTQEFWRERFAFAATVPRLLA